MANNIEKERGVKAQQAANAFEAAVTRDPPILYTQEDCQGFIEQAVKRSGRAHSFKDATQPKN
jgi:hypothetical protein